MSDVAVAPNTPPPSTPAAPAAPAVTEVPVNPNPVTAPTPIGSQAPDKPESSRREAIQKAFAKAREINPPRPREAKIGDNQPPEPIDREKPTLNLRKRPDEQPRARSEHGHFAPKATEGQPNGQTQLRPAGAPQPGRQHPQLPEGTPYQHPPQRMHEHAKAAWAATPEPVRGEVHRMQQEFARAYQRYRPDVEAFNTIKPFFEMARQQGTTVERALHNYTQMEHKLRQDPIAGLDIIVHNLNLRADDGSRITLRDIAWHILNQTPEQHQLVQTQNAASAQNQQIGQLSQIVGQLASGMRQMHYEKQFSQTRFALDRYADAHPRFDELGALIEREIKLGFSLDEAYRRAELLRPATHAAQTRTPTAQTRTATGKSIHGAPAGPSNGTGQRHGKPVGRREAIAGAIKRASGSL